MANTIYYKSIKDEILKLISQNKSKPRYIFPSENILAMKYNASRSTIRKALAELESEGKIAKIRGKGSIIVNDNKTTPQNINLAIILPNNNTVFSNSLLKNINYYCAEKNIFVSVMLSLNNFRNEESCLINAHTLNFDGIILMPVDDDIYNRELLKLVVDNFPIVLLDRKLSGLDLPYVSTNHYEMGFKACEWLCEKHEHIAIASFSKILSSSKDRLDGYLDALKKYRPDAKSYVIQLSHHDLTSTPDATLGRLTRFFNDNKEITAVITNSGGEFNIIHQALLSLNRKMEFILFDNEYDSYNLGKDKYSIICQNCDMLASNVVNILHTAILNKYKNNTTDLNINKSVIVSPVCEFLPKET